MGPHCSYEDRQGVLPGIEFPRRICGNHISRSQFAELRVVAVPEKHPKIVESPHYHIWTDALHARSLSHQAANRWDRATYVRWSITTAWTVFEMACEDALEEAGIGHRFKERVDKAIDKKGLSPLEWGSGIWQEVLDVHKARREFVHVNISQQALFAETEDADKAIDVLRQGIKSIYEHAGKSPPKWIDDSVDRGWDTGRDSFGHLTVIRAGVKENENDAIKITYTYKDREFVSEMLPAGADPEPVIDQLINNVNMPISRVRAYVGDTILIDRNLPMRGT